VKRSKLKATPIGAIAIGQRLEAEGQKVRKLEDRLGRNNYKFSVLDEMIVKNKSCVNL